MEWHSFTHTYIRSLHTYTHTCIQAYMYNYMSTSHTYSFTYLHMYLQHNLHYWLPVQELEIFNSHTNKIECIIWECLCTHLDYTIKCAIGI
uniref:Uncharacterized protein n=1 Tax=Arundo donax TaxID=35708 RepID=A0A0A9E254_ARUDO